MQTGIIIPGLFGTITLILWNILLRWGAGLDGGTGAGVFAGFFIYLAAPMTGAWMLSVTSDRFRAVYANRVLFFTVLGALIALAGSLDRPGNGDGGLLQASLTALRTIVGWTLAGAVIARLTRPGPPERR